ncbi:MAG: hypothetical protein B1H13_14765 [Desulfobacteraceae bacterium 4484_190.3]|nr:MAG: hypothetical protein B1H13_14765 [Desulfobacteraceae bacterium 4484_190.3]
MAILHRGYAQTGDPSEGWGVQATCGQILILEIPQCIPVVEIFACLDLEIFACLDLEQTISFLDVH